MPGWKCVRRPNKRATRESTSQGGSQEKHLPSVASSPSPPFPVDGFSCCVSWTSVEQEMFCASDSSVLGSDWLRAVQHGAASLRLTRLLLMELFFFPIGPELRFKRRARTPASYLRWRSVRRRWDDESRQHNIGELADPYHTQTLQTLPPSIMRLANSLTTAKDAHWLTRTGYW